ncbi:MAG: cytochrome c [Proteobacteria bacterium]|nr:cytochrome c [Pseudomonadota bacterium]
MRGFGAVIGILAVLGGAANALAAEDKDLIDYRQHIMKSLDAQVAILGMILSGAAPEDNLVSHLDTIALIAQGTLQSFEAKAPGGESSPEVWAKWPDFSQRMNAFAAATAKVAKMAREQGKDAIMGEVAGALSCKSCHDVYRVK